MFAWLEKLLSTLTQGSRAGREPTLFVVAAPSGAGKTSLVRALVERDDTLRLSISYTTRARREREIDGQDYCFVELARFRELEDAGEMLESADVFGNRYGTSKRKVDDLLAAGHHVILEIDWQGARQVRQAAPACQSIFILPPSREELERRLRGRRTDSDEVIARRLGESLDDMSHWREFDYLVVNDDFDAAVADLQRIVAGDAAELRTDRPAAARFAASLLA